LVGYGMLHKPLFLPLLSHAVPSRQPELNPVAADGWITVNADGELWCHPTRRAPPPEWAYVMAHGLLHLGFGHFVRGRGKQPREWTAASCLVAERFLGELKFGCRPEDFGVASGAGSTRPEEALYEEFCRTGVPDHIRPCAPEGLHCPDEDVRQRRRGRFGRYGAWSTPPDWEALFGQGLSDAVRQAVDTVAVDTRSGGRTRLSRPLELARRWFLNSYPLLGSLAAHFDVVEDRAVCQRLEIAVAAVDEDAAEILVNPLAMLDEQQARFVLAHELLHVGLRHARRRQGRDAFLWNAACDFAINGWLVEMGVGALPADGGLFDPSLMGLSAEAIYDRLVTDIRRGRRLATLRGRGLGDMLDRPDGRFAWPGEGMSLDEFCRRVLAQGLVYHQEQCRGLLPAALVEEIRALGQPPIPWDVELARWFAHHFPPQEKTRSYLRLSRRQSATPDIPRPRLSPPPPSVAGRTFGVVLDTSGSMDRHLLAQALGAIASYSQAREVPAARIVFCDAAAYDQGYLPPETIAGRVRVRGRGGTELQPGIDLLEHADDFPKQAPILVITDAACDVLRIRRDHAFLLPEGRKLPFAPHGPVFRIG
jgi:predicted metal-dependent peptidase